MAFSFETREWSGDDADLQKAWEIQSAHLLDDSRAPDERRGFLVVHYRPADLRKLLSKGGRLYLAESAGVLVGYLLVTDGHQFASRFVDSRIEWFDGPQSPCAIAFARGEFSYLDQGSVASSFVGRGVARTLNKLAEQACPYGLCVSAIVDRPWKNVRSQEVSKQAGYKPVGRALTPRVGNDTPLESLIFAKWVSR